MKKKNRWSYFISMFIIIGCCIGCNVDNMESNTSKEFPVKIFGIIPDCAYPGETVTIYGADFGKVIKASLGEITLDLVSSNDEKIIVKLPASVVSGDLVIETDKGKGVYKGYYIQTTLSIDSIRPLRVTYNGKMMIYGKGFDAYNKQKNLISVAQSSGDISAFEVVNAWSDSIEVLAKDYFAEKGAIKVSIAGQSALSSETLKFVTDARIDNIAPRRAGSGTLLTISGMNFITNNISLNKVTCGGVKLEVVSVPNRSLMTVRVPHRLDKTAPIRIEVPGEEEACFSPMAFRFDPTVDFDLGTYGLTLSNINNFGKAVTQEYVDEFLAIGVRYISVRMPLTDSEGLISGELPTSTEGIIAMNNAILIHALSHGKIKVILILEHSNDGAWNKASTTTVNQFFENTKQHSLSVNSTTYTLWNSISVFQVLNTSIKFTSTLSTLIDKLFRPVFNYIHPNGYPITGEKLICAPQAILNNINPFNTPNEIVSSGFFDYIDLYNFQWNTTSGGSGKEYYYVELPPNIFNTHYLNRGYTSIKAVPDYPICFIAGEINCNSASARYIKLESLATAIITTVKEMQKEGMHFKGFSYRGGVEDYTGIFNNTASGIPASPTITPSQMYKEIVVSTGGQYPNH